MTKQEFENRYLEIFQNTVNSDQTKKAIYKNFEKYVGQTDPIPIEDIVLTSINITLAINNGFLKAVLEEILQFDE